MNKPLISIVCPVYNSEAFLEECVLSTINQTDGNWELMLIDDGSIDKSSQICDRLSESDGRIKVIHKANAGQMQARIDGINSSSGDYIMFLDSDDLLKKDAIEKIRVNILNNPNKDAYIFNADTFPKKENNKPLPTVEAEKELATNANIIQYTFGNQMFGYLWMYCFRKDVLLESIKKKNLFMNIRYTEDGAFIYNALSICKSIETMKQTLYLYRNNATSITHNITEKDRIDRYCVFEYIYSSIYESQKEFKPSLGISSMVSWAMISMLIHINDRARFKIMFKEARKSTILHKISNNAKINNRQFNLCRLLLKMNLPCLFFKYTHK